MIPIVFRPLSVAAVYLRKRAIDLGQKTRKAAVINEIHELFILRANAIDGSAIVTALEVPPYLAGGLGGQNGGTDYFTPFIAVDYGPLLNSVMKPSLKLVDEAPAPTLKEDPKFLLVATGGRVTIGDLPVWSATRNALNATVGQFYVYPSAIMVPVCLTTDTTPTPDTRTLLLARLNGYMKQVDANDVVVGAGRPAVDGGPATGRPQAITAVEISREALGGTEDDLLAKASACLEWGALRGIAGVAIDRYGAIVVESRRFALLGYQTTDAGAGEVPRYTGAATWQSDISATTIPGSDQPDDVTAEAEVAPGYNFPPWATSNGSVAGRAARNGLFDFPDAAICRMWAPNAGYDAPAESTMMILQVRIGAALADFSAEAWTGASSSPTYGTFDVPANEGHRFITYVVNISTAGALTFTKLDEFVYARFDPAYFAQIERIDYKPYLGINTFAGEPRIICAKRTNNYEILPAEPDIPETPTTPRVQGELERKVLTQYNAYVRLADLGFVCVAPSGAETVLQLGAFYPALYTHSTSGVGTTPAPSDGRIGFVDTTLAPNEPRYALAIPGVFCQYAPGIVAVLLSPNSDYPLSVHTLYVGLFDVATGVLIQMSPALLGYTTLTRFNLSCFEQGTVDEDGVLTSHGRLLVMASSLDDSPTRGDGIFAINELSKVTWVSREPSNTPVHYIGNPLAPATIGVSTNLIGIKPTKIPE